MLHLNQNVVLARLGSFCSFKLLPQVDQAHQLVRPEDGFGDFAPLVKQRFKNGEPTTVLESNCFIETIRQVDGRLVFQQGRVGFPHRSRSSQISFFGQFRQEDLIMGVRPITFFWDDPSIPPRVESRIRSQFIRFNRELSGEVECPDFNVVPTLIHPSGPTVLNDRRTFLPRYRTNGRKEALEWSGFYSPSIVGWTPVSAIEQACANLCLFDLNATDFTKWRAIDLSKVEDDQLSFMAWDHYARHEAKRLVGSH